MGWTVDDMAPAFAFSRGLTDPPGTLIGSNWVITSKYMDRLVTIQ